MQIVNISVLTDDGLSQDFTPADSIPFITQVDVKKSDGTIYPFIPNVPPATP